MKKILLLLSLFICYFPLFAQYCHPHTGNLFSSHQIQYFQLGNFVNITGDTNILEYTDFSDSLMIYAEVGQEYNLVLSKGPNPWGFMAGNTLGYSIWIDYNNDTIFSDNELVYSKYYNGSIYTYVGTLLITDNSLNGVYRLRLRNEWGARPDSPCDTLGGGETEDYAITISNNQPPQDIPIGSEGIALTLILLITSVALKKFILAPIDNNNIFRFLLDPKK